jgi:hypothetical protein
MSFDIGTARAPALNSGSFFQLTDPTGKPIVDEKGGRVGVVLLARNGAVGMAKYRDLGNQRLAKARAGTLGQQTVETNEAEGSDILAALTKSWTFDLVDGEDFQCTPENALRFWSDDRNVRWRREAEDFVASEANFMKA